MARYMLDNAWCDSRYRLNLLEQTLDPATIRRLQALGVRSGARCLEVGAGGGSVARWLCAQVAPHGQVLAVDLDTRFLESLKEPCLEVRRADIVTDCLGERIFDAVHVRMVLAHIAARDGVLRALVAALRPGGMILVEELDYYPVFAVATGLYLEVWKAKRRAWTAAGGNAEWARSLPQLLQQEGLTDVQAETDVPVFCGGSPMARFWQVTWRQLRESLVVQGGLCEEILDEAMALLSRPDEWFPNFALVAAWGRRPD